MRRTYTRLLLGFALSLTALGTSCKKADPPPAASTAEPAPPPPQTASESPEPVEAAPPTTESASERFFDVTGVVLDTAGAPVPEAMVMQGGRPEEHLLTDAGGQFRITLERRDDSVPAVVASKMGYRAVGLHLFEAPEEPVELRMSQVAGPDNVEYVYEDPGDGIDTELENCTHCHQPMVKQFLASKHAESTRNPLVQDLYAGVNRALHTQQACELAGGRWMQGLEPGTADGTVYKCYLGEGVLPSLNPQCGDGSSGACDDPTREEANQPTHFGACADCHAPGINGVAGGRNLHEAVGTAFEKGVHCDTCHKVADIDLSKPPGVGQRLVMGRPSEPGSNTFQWEPVYYGPIIDVPNPMMRASYQPKFNEAQFCAGCHEQKQAALLPGQSLDAVRWPNGLPVHSTFSEWQAGPYAESGVPCQHCHMPATVGALNSLPMLVDKRDESIIFGWERPIADNRMHLFRGPLDGNPRLINRALHVHITTERSDNQVTARISVANIRAGHAVPTGEPMRAILLHVEALSASCGKLAPTGGPLIDAVGGAIATGVVGQDVTIDGTSVTWSADNIRFQTGQRLRVVRATGTYYDYEGIGFFGQPDRSAREKGMPVHTPVGDAEIVRITANTLTLRTPLSVSPGDIVYLGEAWPDTPEDGAPSRHLAGMAGQSFARVLSDSRGKHQVPHYRATDMVRDNRIAPGTFALSEHVFARGDACTEGTVRATVLYRPRPLPLAKAQGWEALDYVIAVGETRW